MKPVKVVSTWVNGRMRLNTDVRLRVHSAKEEWRIIMKDDSNSIQALIDALNEGKFNYDGFHCDDYNFGFNDGIDFAVGKITTWFIVNRQGKDDKPEPLTDREQRIFLAAMSREENICKQVDNQLRNTDGPVLDSLVSVCHEITRKVKSALWSL